MQRTISFTVNIFCILLAIQFQRSARAGGPPKNDCYDTAMTQAAMNDCADADFKSADAEMKATCRKLMKRSTNRYFKKALLSSQRAWLRYRDSQISLHYPDPNEFYGTIRPMCHAQIIAELTRRRTDELKKMLQPEEGDVCGF